MTTAQLSVATDIKRLLKTNPVRAKIIPLLLKYASSAPQGIFVEIGVYRGISAMVLATLDRELHLFDTFCGHPYHIAVDRHKTGEFGNTSVDLVKERVPSAVIHEGVFPGSLPQLSPVAFVHADADQYQTTKDICLYMPPIMVKGGIIFFDDYKLKGCRKAIRECLTNFTIIAHHKAVWVKS